MAACFKCGLYKGLVLSKEIKPGNLVTAGFGQVEDNFLKLKALYFHHTTNSHWHS